MSQKNEEWSKDILDAIINGGNVDEALKKINENFKNVSLEEYKVKLKFQNDSTNPDPEYAKKSDSGFDLRAFIDEPIILKPLERTLVPTGLYFEIPEGYEIQVRPRSGLAAKHGITVLNTPGTIDAGYRGELKVILINLSTENFTIESGERIAQAVFTNVANSVLTNLIRIDKVSLDTDRGDGGFGSTGKK